jgi:hypothetical protein
MNESLQASPASDEYTYYLPRACFGTKGVSHSPCFSRAGEPGGGKWVALQLGDVHLPPLERRPRHAAPTSHPGPREPRRNCCQCRRRNRCLLLATMPNAFSRHSEGATRRKSRQARARPLRTTPRRRRLGDSSGARAPCVAARVLGSRHGARVSGVEKDERISLCGRRAALPVPCTRHRICAS